MSSQQATVKMSIPGPRVVLLGWKMYRPSVLRLQRIVALRADGHSPMMGASHLGMLAERWR